MGLIENWRYNRDAEKARKNTEFVVEGFWEAFFVATTFHGRYKMSKVCISADAGEIEVDPKVIGFFKFLIVNVPYRIYANLN